ncbi:hypothetical protein AAC387_Pa04g2192 [Persea americana]
MVTAAEKREMGYILKTRQRLELGMVKILMMVIIADMGNELAPTHCHSFSMGCSSSRIERKWERKGSLQKKLFHGDLRERPLCSSRSESFSPISRRNARIFLLEIVLMLSLLGFGEKSLRHCRVEGFVRDDAFRVRTNREERAAFGVLINTTLQLLQ